MFFFEELTVMPLDHDIEFVIEIAPKPFLCIRDHIGWLLNN
jgi:hypothetical protein